MTKVHKVTLLIVDHDNLGARGVVETLENHRYPNHCIAPGVMSIETQEVEWSDDHPLNNRKTQAAAAQNLFGARP